MRKFFLSFIILAQTLSIRAESYREQFINPTEENRPIIIWQWMDGLVSEDAITADLEAFKEAGLAGVQNFQIGGKQQIRVGNPDCAIGSDTWREMIRWTLQECERLGLTFGTHNCPGWSSSAFGSVTPEYSMQKLVFSRVELTPGELTKLQKGKTPLKIYRPSVDSTYNYYEDIAVLAFPADSIVSLKDIKDLSSALEDNLIPHIDAIPLYHGKNTVVMRIGHTTNGKTNESQAPLSGQGLECDKMSREAVKRFWDGYPSMLIEIADDMAGKTFKYIEIDSYETGGQTWSKVLPDKFQSRKGYDITPYLPLLADNIIIDSHESSKKFMKDIEDVVTSLFAENYYGYMSELVSAILGMHLMIEPYGTGSQKPFPILDIYKILKAAPDATIATEFWVKPGWGWRDMGRHEKVIRQTQRPTLYAEGFTCWPLYAWQDDPNSLKPICDRAFCSGVNRMMLHAGAVNPWLDVEPGMSFGIWGTQFVPNQTWWRAGGAKALFDYMARCQSLLQRGLPSMEQNSLDTPYATYHRVDGDNDIFFLCNPSDSTVTSHIDISPLTKGRKAELWDAYNLSMHELSADNFELTIEPHGSRFIIISSILIPPADTDNYPESALLTSSAKQSDQTLELNSGWTLSFPNKDGEALTLKLDSLTDWTKLNDLNARYFSGTATYKNSFKYKQKNKRDNTVILDLGEAKNMALVRLNGKEYPVMWKTPFLLDISDGIKNGDNEIEIEITNLWVNRMVGDEQEPDDIEWSEPLQYTFAKGSPVAGRYMAAIPEWLEKGQARPSKNRKTVVGFKFFNADSPLLPSGLLGPVVIYNMPPSINK